jgi:hypothetical protein
MYNQFLNKKIDLDISFLISSSNSQVFKGLSFLINSDHKEEVLILLSPNKEIITKNFIIIWSPQQDSNPRSQSRNLMLCRLSYRDL